MYRADPFLCKAHNLIYRINPLLYKAHHLIYRSALDSNEVHHLCMKWDAHHIYHTLKPVIAFHTEICPSINPLKRNSDIHL